MDTTTIGDPTDDQTPDAPGVGGPSTTDLAARLDRIEDAFGLILRLIEALAANYKPVRRALDQALKPD